MRPTLDQIEAFYWITRLDGFRSAAVQLRVSQPTVSLRVRALERALGVRLFERAGRRARLTREGEALLPFALRMVELADAVSAAHTSHDPLNGQLRLGAPASFALSCMADFLGTLKRQQPELAVALTVDNSVVLCERLNRRELDMALVVEPDVKPYVRVELLGAMRHVWIAGAELRLPAVVTPHDLVRLQVFTHPEPSNLMVIVRNWFRSAGVEPERIRTCNDLSVIIRLTSAGEGVSLLPPAIISNELRAGALRALKVRPDVDRSRLYVAYQVDKIGPGMNMLCETVQRVVRRSTLLAAPKAPDGHTAARRITGRRTP